MKPNGQSDDDVRRIAESQFPLKGLYKEFTFWNCYVVLMDSEKFRAGVDAGWPKKQRLNLAGDYSNSSGSHELPGDAQESPRTGSLNSPVQSASPPTGKSTVELAELARQQTTMNMWNIVNQWKTA